MAIKITLHDSELPRAKRLNPRAKALLRRLRLGESIDLSDRHRATIFALKELGFVTDVVRSVGLDRYGRARGQWTLTTTLTPLPKEKEWRPVVGCEDLFQVSADGTVMRIGAARGSHQGKVLKATLNSKGYPRVSLGGAGRRLLHHIVAEAFLGPRPDGMVIAHNDGDRENASASNLRYCTSVENCADQKAHGTSPDGERNAQHKLTWAMVEQIRHSHRAGCRLNGTKPLARRFGVAPSTIRHCVNGVTWDRGS